LTIFQKFFFNNFENLFIKPVFSSSIYIIPNAIPLANYTSSLSNVTVFITESSGSSPPPPPPPPRDAERGCETWSIGGEGRGGFERNVDWLDCSR
jgi:hypothetical protein